MGDRTACALMLVGTIPPAEVEPLVEALNEAGASEFKIDEQMRAHASGEPFVTLFDEVNYAEFPVELEPVLKRLGLEFAWGWAHGDQFDAGLRVVMDGFDETTDYAYSDREVLARASDLDEPKRVDVIRRCQEFITRGRFALRLRPRAAQAKTTLEVLRAARAKITKPEAWSAKGAGNDGTGDKPAQFCAMAAIYYSAARIAGENESLVTAHVRDALRRAIPGIHDRPHFGVLSVWNDDDETTHADVLAAFDRAIEIAEREKDGA